jgi:hypothetical protein
MSSAILSNAHLSGQLYLNGSWLCFDLECSGTEKGHAIVPGNRVVCVSWRTSAGKRREFYGNLLDAREFWQDIEDADFLIAHNAKYEAHWLLRLGADPADLIWFDPMLAEWVLLGNNPDSLSLSLDEVGQRYGLCPKDPLVAAMLEYGIDAADIPDFLMQGRCTLDVDMTVHVFEQQLERLAARGILPLVAQRCALMPVLTHIERNGIKLDSERVITQHKDCQQQLAMLRAELNALCGGEINERSPNVMIPLVYGIYPAGTKEENKTIKPLGFKEVKDRSGRPKRGKVSKSWPEGRPLLNKNVIAKLEDQATTKRQREWVRLRRIIGKVSALLSKNLDFFRGIVEEREGKFYAEIMQGVTATHRLSGRGRPVAFAMFDGARKSVQSQNMPRDLKSLQCAESDEDDCFDIDGAQLEFRAAAFLGNDAQAKADIDNPRFDAHIQTLTFMLNGGVWSQEKYDDLLDRYRAGDKDIKHQRADNALCKSHTFKPLFDGSRGTPEQEAYYEWFKKKYHGIASACKANLELVERGKCVRVCGGMEFRWNVEHRNGRCYNKVSGKPVSPSVYNYWIQYFATGEMIPLALIYLFYRIRTHKLRARLTNTVHDSATGYVHKEDRLKFWEHAKEAFTRDTAEHLAKFYALHYNVLMGVEAHFGSHVGEGDKYVYNWKREVAK